MPRGFDGKLTEYGKTRVTLDSSGNGTAAVTFAESFPDTPSTLVVARRGDVGSYTAASPTKSGFTLTVTTSDIRSQDLDVLWFAHEKS